MMINLQALIPDSMPCIVEANDIKSIYQDEVQAGRSTEMYLLLERYSDPKTIQLKYIGYSKDVSAEVMSKVAFAINAAKTNTAPEGDTCQP